MSNLFETEDDKPWLQYVWSMRAGSKYPADAIMVDRTTRFGNPFIVGIHGAQGKCCAKHAAWLDTGESFGNPRATEELRQWVLDHVKELRGQNLLCWCKPKPCHANKLAYLANPALPTTIVVDR